MGQNFQAKWFKLFQMRASLFSLMWLNLLFPPSELSAAEKSPMEALRKANAETEKLRDEVFNKLVFRLVESNPLKSKNFKLLVKDQLGRDWIFKAGESAAEDGAVAVYRLFRLFGLETPEIHYKAFKINDEIGRAHV